jgi:hypothetical protein
MAFLASTVSLQVAFENLLNIALQQKTYLANWSTRLQSNITALDAMEIVSSVNRAVAAMNTIAATPGLDVYAQQQFDNPAYDVVAEFNAMRNSLVAITNWLKANIPANAITVTNGEAVGAVYAPAVTAPLKTLVDAARATIA